MQKVKIKIKSILQSILLYLRMHPVRAAVAGAVVVGLLPIWSLTAFLVPRTLHYSFASSSSCTFSPVLMPAKLPADHAATFSLQYGQTMHVGGVLLYAGRVCAVPVSAPKAGTAYRSARAFSVLLPIRKTLGIKTAEYARVTPASVKKPIALSDNLSFTLDQPDYTFAYALVSGDHTSTCSRQAQHLTCPVKPLSLNYGGNYSLHLVRVFRGHAGPAVAQSSFQTIAAVTITNASVSDGSTVYDAPQQFTFQTDKTLKTLGKVTLSVVNADGTEQPVTASASFVGNTITLAVAQPLPRNVTMHLQIASLTAQDSSGLAVPYGISFKVSGGPQLTGNSLTKYNVTAGRIVLTFDQQLDPNQAITSQVNLLADGAAVAARMSVSGSQVIITPQAGYPLCAHLSLTVGNGVTSNYGIGGNSDYSFAARAQCHTTFSIGTSVNGRAITAYKIGSGSSMILFVGTMHGNEQNSGNLLDKWLDELEANVDTVPAGRSVVIVPRINPDGAAANTRTNANGIDLNRNFSSASWKSVVTEPDGTVGPAGGPSPLSEPESQALANYVQAQRPRLTVDYHSHAGIVQGNDAGDADALALQYATRSGYSLISSGDSGSVFDYDTTGSFEDWAAENPGLPEFIVELTSATNDEFTKNRSAMWYLVRSS